MEINLEKISRIEVVNYATNKHKLGILVSLFNTVKVMNNAALYTVIIVVAVIFIASLVDLIKQTGKTKDDV